MTLFNKILVSSLFALHTSSFAETLKPDAWIALPAIGSSPETGFQYGAYVMRIFPQTQIGVPQNRLEVLLQGTSEGQYQAYVWPNIYLQNGLWQVRASLGGRYWPGYYYGQGNNTPEKNQAYADTTFESSVTVNYQLSDLASIGGSYFIENHDIEIDSNAEHKLFNPDLSGVEGGVYSGIGANASLDSRDNLDWPNSGQLLQTGFNWFDQNLASDENFHTWYANIATYYPLGSQVLAAALRIDSASKNTPFTHLPRPQGDRSLRGADGNRWIDNAAFGLQTEIRKTLNAKLATVLFADAFQVNEGFQQMAMEHFHTSLGGGIRYSMTPDRFNIRLDIGWVDLTSTGFAISVGEAF